MLISNNTWQGKIICYIVQILGLLQPIFWCQNFVDFYRSTSLYISYTLVHVIQVLAIQDTWSVPD